MRNIRPSIRSRPVSLFVTRLLWFVPALAAVLPADALTLTAARRSWVDHTKVTVTFSEAVSPASATVAANYSIERATVLDAEMGATSSNVVLRTSAIDFGPAPTLGVNGVQNLALTQTLLEAVIPVSLAPLLPAEMGTIVNGFQDDFDAASRSPDWIALGPDVYWQAGGRLNFGAGGGDPNHLVYFNPAYAGSAQEILARLRLTGASAQDVAFAGVAVGVPTNSLSLPVRGGLNLNLNNANAYGGPPQRHLRFLSDYTVFGPVLGFAWTTNVWYWVRLRQAPEGVGPDAFAKVWLADGDTPEPTVWQADWDFSPARSGYAGFRSAILEVPGVVADCQVDYVLIKAGGLPTITPMPATFQDDPALKLLTIARQAEDAVVSWPGAAGAAQLEESSNLAVWAVSPHSVASNAGQFAATVPLTNPAAHFRTAPLPATPTPPVAFDFNFGAATSDTITHSWLADEVVTALDANRTQRIRTYTQPGDGFKLQVEAVEFADYPAREWKLWFENPPGTFFYLNHTGLSNAPTTVTFSEHTHTLPGPANPAKQLTAEYADRGLFFDAAAPAYWDSALSGNVSGGQALNYQPYGPGFTQPTFPIHFLRPVTNAAFALVVEGGSSTATFDLLRNGTLVTSVAAPVGAANSNNFYNFQGIAGGFDTIRITPNMQPAYLRLDAVQHDITLSQSISLDFNGRGAGDPAPITYAGGGPGGGYLWNGVTVSNATPNVASQTNNFLAGDGSATSLTLSLSNFSGADLYSTDTYGANRLFEDYLVQSSTVGTANVILGGLLPGATYELYLLAANDGGSVGGVFSVNGSPLRICSGAPATAINPADTSLRLWLRADTLSGATVPQWTDSSSYGTAFGVPALGEAATDPANHTPQLVTRTTAAGTFKAVQFRNANDPVSGSHQADRLWQTNNLGASDPTAIASGSDFTLFVVYRNAAPNTALGPDQCIVAKRGPSEAPFQFGFNANTVKSRYVTYGGSTIYDSANAVPASPEWGVIEMNVTGGSQLTFREYYSSLGGWRTYTVAAARDGSGASPVAADFWAAAGTPLSLGFHTQSIGATANNPFGNGTYERFAGDIAEILLYARSLPPAELAAVENYFVNKFITPEVVTGTPFTEGFDFVHFIAQANSDGNLVVTVTGEQDAGGGNSLSVLNGLQLVGPSPPVVLPATNVSNLLLSKLWAGEIHLGRSPDGEFVLHYADGSSALITDFRPRTATLLPNSTLNLSPVGGRSSDGVLPYFNIAKPGGGGCIAAVGWTGQWKASFDRDAGTNLTVRIGMEDFNLRLFPGERIRTPAVLTLSYEGDWLDGQRQLRRLLLDHYSPRPNGLPLDLPIAASGATLGFNNVTVTNQIQAITNIIHKQLPVDTYWIDAGWEIGGFATGQGNNIPDPTRFPNGLAPVSQCAHTNGLRFLLWFEPERVMPGTWLRTHHPDWLLTPSGMPPAYAYQQNDGWRMLDLGNPAALHWAKTNFSALITQWGIDIYRHDFNMHPLWYWRTGEPSDRQGMNEIRYIMGLYEYFDALQDDHPGLLMDNSASGGRRLDFEMYRRLVPLLRSDYLWEVVGAQAMTHALSHWLPLTGQGGVSTANYDFRSGMGSWGAYAFDYYSPGAAFWTPLRSQLANLATLNYLFGGDFYPLTPYSTYNADWMAWQFDRPDLGEGLVQAFRRADSLTASLGLRLAGLSPGATYQLIHFESATTNTASGRQLLNDGLTVRIATAPEAATLKYRRIAP